LVSSSRTMWPVMAVLSMPKEPPHMQCDLDGL
jgi:hypothetical protein